MVNSSNFLPLWALVYCLCNKWVWIPKKFVLQCDLLKMSLYFWVYGPLVIVQWNVSCFPHCIRDYDFNSYQMKILVQSKNTIYYLPNAHPIWELEAGILSLGYLDRVALLTFVSFYATEILCALDLTVRGTPTAAQAWDGPSGEQSKPPTLYPPYSDSEIMGMQSQMPGVNLLYLPIPPLHAPLRGLSKTMSSKE